MNLFLDSSVLLAACGSTRGASRALFHYAPANDWTLLASPYVLAEVAKNVRLFPPAALVQWRELASALHIVDDIVTLDRINIFPAAKDRPVLLTALASAPVLLTLDRNDFGKLLDGEFYGLDIMLPADFFRHQPAGGTLHEHKTS